MLGPPPAGGGYPLPHPPPFGASRLSEAFSFRPCAPAVFDRAPEKNKLDTPVQTFMQTPSLIQCKGKDSCVSCTITIKWHVRVIVQITDPLRLNDPAFDLDEQRLNPVHTVVYQSRPIWLPKIT